MALLRFVQPETVRIYLDGSGSGEWIEVKKRLSVGEARLAVFSFVGAYNPEGGRTPNLDTLGMGQVAAYLVNWSARDAADLPVPVSMDSLKSLALESYATIEKAIERHVAAVEAEDAAREKKNAGEYRARAISDFVICREMGWTLPDLWAVPIDQYAILVDWLGEQLKARVRE